MKYQALSSQEVDEIKQKLTEFAAVEGPEDLMQYLHEMEVSDGDVLIRFFLTPEHGKPEGVYFEVDVRADADWYEDQLGSYSSDNLRNGGGPYEALAEQLETAVEDVLGTRPAFVMGKGSGAFTAEVAL